MAGAVSTCANPGCSPGIPFQLLTPGTAMALRGFHCIPAASELMAGPGRLSPVEDPTLCWSPDQQVGWTFLPKGGLSLHISYCISDRKRLNSFVNAYTRLRSGNRGVSRNLMDNPYKNIKTAVFLSQYRTLLFGGVIAIIVIAVLWPSFNFYPILGLMLGVVFRTLFIQTRYVAGFEIKEEVLEVKYMTPFFTERTYRKAVNEITDINLENDDELHIVTAGKWESFDLATEKIKRDIEAKVASANIVYAKKRLTSYLSTAKQ